MQDSTAEQIKNQVPVQPEPSVQTMNEPYLAGQILRPAPKVPSFLNKKVYLQTQTRMTVADIAQWVSENTGIPAIADGLDVSSSHHEGITLPGIPTAPSSIDVNYTGTLTGLLNMVADKAGVWWRFDNGRIVFYKTETKTFELPALAWTTNSIGSIVASSGASAGASSGGSGGSGGSGNTSNGSSSTAMKSSVDFWKGLESTAKAVGGGATIVTDASTGSITVTGTPPQIDQVSAWVKSNYLNKSPSRFMCTALA
jgi:hypothetical protein